MEVTAAGETTETVENCIEALTAGLATAVVSEAEVALTVVMEGESNFSVGVTFTSTSAVYWGTLSCPQAVRKGIIKRSFRLIITLSSFLLIL